MKKLPKYIRIIADKVAIRYNKKLPYQGRFSCTTKLIEVYPQKDIGNVLLHEIMEYIASSMYAIYFDKSNQRHINLIHAPEQGVDVFAPYGEILLDTIRRNKLDWIFKEEV